MVFLLNFKAIFAFIFIALLFVSGCSTVEESISSDPRYYEGEPILLQFPFKDGEYYISQGGHFRSQNYHYWSDNFRSMGIYVSMRYAVDIHKVGEAGIDLNKRPASDLNDFAMFGEVLYSPATGVVHYLQDGFPDMPPGIRDVENPRGNHIVLDVDGVRIAMLHLKKGSILVDIGQEVEAGQPIAKIGNSGHTTLPHLHIQASYGDTWHGHSVPMLFDGEFLVKGDRINAR